MRRRSALRLIIGAGTGWMLCLEAQAQPAHSNAGGNGNGGGNQGGDNGGGNNGNGDSGENGNQGNGNAGGGGNSGNNGQDSGNQGNGSEGNGNQGNASTDGAGEPGPTSGPRLLPDQDVARRAVERAAARPLSEIVATAKRDGKGEVIDARLVTVRGFLLYELKVLSGRSVEKVYFYARSGRPVREP